MRTFLGLADWRDRGRRAQADPDPSRTIARRIRTAVAALFVVTLLGTVGYVLLGFTVLEAVYQTVTTVATVGFREVRPLNETGMVFTIALIILGVGTVLYNLGVLVEIFTEGDLRHQLGRRRMDKEIEQMHGHVIICGYGRVGVAAEERLRATGVDVVVVDVDPGRLAEAKSPNLVGDVTQDEVLVRAGILRARALVATLETDANTLYLTLSARALAPELVIVARAGTTDSMEKLRLAGATRVVSPQVMGGRRLATFALQPHVTEFIDLVTHDERVDLQIEELEVTPGSAYAGHTVAELDASSRTGATLLAMRAAEDQEFTPSPGRGVRLPPGAVLIVFGTRAQLDELSGLVSA